MFKVSSNEIVKVIKLCPILSRSKLLVSFRHDLVVHGLAQMRIGTKSFLGLSFKQVGLRFIHPLRVSSPPFSRLIRLYSSPSTSLPLCAPNSFGESLLLFYIL